MGCGGIFKSIVRTVIVAVATFYGGPMGGALASAAFTGATGGSFKEALMSGAMTYVGASVGAGITSGMNSAAVSIGQEAAIEASLAGAGETAIASAAQSAFAAAGGSGAYSAAATSLIKETGAATIEQAIQQSQGLTNSLYGSLGQANAAVTNGVSKFTEGSSLLGFGGEIVDGAEALYRTPFDVIQSIGDEVLGAGTINLAQPGAQSLIGSLAGAGTTYTLNQALLAGTQEADDLLAAQGYSPQQIQLLKQEARNNLAQKAYDKLLATTNNPGLAEEEFNKIIAAGVERENTALGKDITQEQFDNRFSSPDLGNIILGDETNLRKQAFGAEIGKTFDAKPFESIDDDIINSIVQERAGPARQQVGNFAARGSLNATGGKTANDFLTGQEESAKNRVRQEGDSILGGTQNKITQLRDTATQGIDNYKLGDDLFDPTTFAEQRNKLIQDQQGSLGSDIRGSLGSTPLFDINTALQSGGRAQGAVSGTAGNKSFLDAIAAREGTISGSGDRRGVGSRGSGAF